MNVQVKLWQSIASKLYSCFFTDIFREGSRTLFLIIEYIISFIYINPYETDSIDC